MRPNLRTVALLSMLLVSSRLLGAELTVDLSCEIPAPAEALSDTRLVARLYEYDPRLADSRAKEVDQVTITGLDLRPSGKTRLRLPLSAERSAERRYYVTVFVHPDEKSEKRLYFINGFQKVLEEADEESLKVVLETRSK